MCFYFQYNLQSLNIESLNLIRVDILKEKENSSEGSESSESSEGEPRLSSDQFINELFGGSGQSQLDRLVDIPPSVQLDKYYLRFIFYFC